MLSSLSWGIKFNESEKNQIMNRLGIQFAEYSHHWENPKESKIKSRST